MRIILAIVGVLAVIGAALWYSQRQAQTVDDVSMATSAPTADSAMATADAAMNAATSDMSAQAAVMAAAEEMYDYEGALTDVTVGKVVRGVQTGGNATGVARAGLSDDGRYMLFVEFADLPEPQGDDFYEGWIVRRGENMSVISTGALTRAKGAWHNIYTSQTDLTDHDFYVLTLEPNDGNPAPADHILEGVLTQKEM